MLDAGRKQQQAAARVANRHDAPAHTLPSPCLTPSSSSSSPSLFFNCSDDDCRQTPRNKCAQCATVRVVPCDISARLPSLSSPSSLPPASAGHNSSVVANLLCPILNRCSRRFLYFPVFVLLYSSHSSSLLAQFELGLEINKFHMLVGHTHTSH